MFVPPNAGNDSRPFYACFYQCRYLSPEQQKKGIGFLVYKPTTELYEKGVNNPMWIRLEEVPTYAVNEQGDIKNLKKGKIVKANHNMNYTLYSRALCKNLHFKRNELIKQYFPEVYAMNIQKICKNVNNPDERWKECEGYPNYFISDYGRVFSEKHLILLSICYSSNGYSFVNVKNNEGELKTPLVHRLVAEAFLENPDPKHLTEVDHLNHNRADNRLENLRWVDHKTNIQSRTKCGSHFYVLPERRKTRGRPPLYNIKERNLPKEPVTDPEDPYFWL